LKNVTNYNYKICACLIVLPPKIDRDLVTRTLETFTVCTVHK